MRVALALLLLPDVAVAQDDWLYAPIVAACFRCLLTAALLMPNLAESFSPDSHASQLLLTRQSMMRSRMGISSRRMSTLPGIGLIGLSIIEQGGWL